MPILVPKTELDRLAAEWTKREGILSAMPEHGFTAAAIVKGWGCSASKAERWLKRYGIYAGKILVDRYWSKVYIVHPVDASKPVRQATYAATYIPLKKKRKAK